MAVTRPVPISAHVTRFSRCCGLKPSGPPEEPAGKERTCLLTCSLLTCEGADRGDDVKFGRSDGGSGCFDRSSSSVSRSTFSGLSLEHRILTAALMFPSSNLDATAVATDCSSLNLIFL